MTLNVSTGWDVTLSWPLPAEISPPANGHCRAYESPPHTCVRNVIHAKVSTTNTSVTDNTQRRQIPCHLVLAVERVLPEIRPLTSVCACMSGAGFCSCKWSLSGTVWTSVITLLITMRVGVGRRGDHTEQPCVQPWGGGVCGDLGCLSPAVRNDRASRRSCEVGSCHDNDKTYDLW